jgi:hypothetical protein
MPFEIKDDIIFLDVFINDNDTANTFVFDTGAAIDLLDENVARELGLEPNYQQEVPGAGGTEVYDIVLNQTLRLGKQSEISDTHLLLTDLARLRDKVEKDFDGIVGYSFLKGFVTAIDYENRKLTRYHSIEEVDLSGYTPVTFKFHGGITIPQFDIDITLTNGKTYSGRIFFDSGAAYSLIVNTPFEEANKLSEQAEKLLVLETENLSTKSVSREMAIRSLDLAGLELGEMPIAIANDKEGVSSYKGYLGILGAEVISRFDVILDYTSSTLYIRPNKRFSDPFEFPMSGLALRKVQDTVVVRQVQERSMAYQQGIRQGDIIISVNGDATGDLKLYRDLLKQEGKTCELEVMAADGSRKIVSLKLERLL